MKYAWMTRMRSDRELPLRGQIAMDAHDAGAHLIIMPGPHTFPCDAVISIEDARSLRDALTALIGDAS